MCLNCLSMISLSFSVFSYGSVTTTGFVSTFFAFVANLKVDRVWQKFIAAGDNVHIIIVKELPFRELDRSLVSFESRNGTCVLHYLSIYFLLLLDNLLITLDRTKRLLLM